MKIFQVLKNFLLMITVFQKILNHQIQFLEL